MRRLLLRLVAVAMAFAVLLLAYGVVVEPRFVLDEERIEARLPGLGQEWAGAEVAVFSDLQVGMWLANTGMAQRVIDHVVQAEPAAVLVAGDFLYSREPSVPEQVDTVVELLAPLTDSGIPAYAVLGNHDHAVGAAEQLTAALEDNGVEVLRNESATVPGRDGDPAAQQLHVVGLAPASPALADAGQALRDVPGDAPRLVLMHNPTSFPQLPPGGAPMAVAGHTHCGQIALPGTPRWSDPGLTDEEALVADGFAPPGYGQEGNRLFVTCGVGMSLMPIRINAPPQVLILELQPG